MGYSHRQKVEDPPNRRGRVKNVVKARRCVGPAGARVSPPSSSDSPHNSRPRCRCPCSSPATRTSMTAGGGSPLPPDGRGREVHQMHAGGRKAGEAGDPCPSRWSTSVRGRWKGAYGRPEILGRLPMLLSLDTPLERRRVRRRRGKAACRRGRGRTTGGDERVRRRRRCPSGVFVESGRNRRAGGQRAWGQNWRDVVD